MNEAVIDASAALGAVDGSFQPSQYSLFYAPGFIDLEVCSALRCNVFRQRTTLVEAETHLTLFRNLPIERLEHEQLLSRIWSLRDNLTPYDAAYVALAEQLDVPLLTHDSRIAGSSGHKAQIIVV